MIIFLGAFQFGHQGGDPIEANQLGRFSTLAMMN